MLYEELGIAFVLMLLSSWVVFVFWFSYHCAIRKRGTKWLSYSMVGIVLTALRNILELIRDPSYLEWGTDKYFVELVPLSVLVYYWVSSFNLYKINKKIAFYKFIQKSKECSEYLEKIKNADNLEKLNTIFGDAVRQWPQWERQISQIYKTRKQELLANS